MIIYLDLIFLLNFAFDFILLLVVKLLLKRKIKIYRLILGSLFGALSIFLLFLKLNSLELFAFKVLISFIMLFISFGYQNIRYYGTNFLYLYIVSIVLGGFLYFLNVSFSYKNEGLVFFHKGMSINVIFLIIFSPVILYIYYRQAKRLKNDYSNYYDITIEFLNNRKLNCTAFLDTGNKLACPYSNKDILLVEKNALKNLVSIRNPIIIPYNSLNNHNLLKCIKISNIEINGSKNSNVLLGISEDKFSLDGINCIISTKILEGLK